MGNRNIGPQPENSHIAVPTTSGASSTADRTRHCSFLAAADLLTIKEELVSPRQRLSKGRGSGHLNQRLDSAPTGREEMCC